MLIYLVNGVRDYGRRPVSVQTRRGWEFQAVIEGSISLHHEGGPDVLQSRRLWLFAPNYPHGWTGEKSKSARIVVFHFLFVPKLIEELLRPSGYLEFSLAPRQIRRLVELSDQAAPYLDHPSLGMTICFEHVLLELSMMVLEHQRGQGSLLAQSEKKVSAAIEWFSQRIPQNPGLGQVAAATGMSPSNLRRIFHEVLQASPKNIFDQLRFQRAMQLMSDPAVKLETVGELCGFGSASSFSRAFKIKFGCSPEMWRSAQIEQ